MQNTIKILILALLFFILGQHHALAQTKKKEEAKQETTKEVEEVEGLVDTVVLLGEGLWFEFKKRLNLVSEKELAEKKKKSYKVKVGKFSVEK